MVDRPWWPSGLRRYLKFKKRECLRSQGPIPARDYDIDRSEVEILCLYSNSRAPVTCVAFNIKWWLESRRKSPVTEWPNGPQMLTDYSVTGLLSQVTKCLSVNKPFSYRTCVDHSVTGHVRVSLVKTFCNWRSYLSVTRDAKNFNEESRRVVVRITIVTVVQKTDDVFDQLLLVQPLQTKTLYNAIQNNSNKNNMMGSEYQTVK